MRVTSAFLCCLVSVMGCSETQSSPTDNILTQPGTPAGDVSMPPGGTAGGAADGDPVQDPGTRDDSDGSRGSDGSAGYDYEMEQVSLDADMVIAAGQTMRLGPGTAVTAAAGVAIRVEGTLIAEGTVEAPVSFMGGGVPRSWHGIVVASGGYLELTNVEIGGATYGIHAMPGSDFKVDYADIGTSFKAAVLESDGSFDHTKFHASGDPAFALSSDASIDDVNGNLTIINASPSISNSSFDNTAALVNVVQTGGADSHPTFDHVRITGGHCGIHMYGTPSSPPVIKNTVFDGVAYAVMAYATSPDIQDSVFLNNATDVGYCFEATEADVPTLNNNYYSSGSVALDASCTGIGTTDNSPASTANPTAGPIGL